MKNQNKTQYPHQFWQESNPLSLKALSYENYRKYYLSNQKSF